MFHSVFTSIEHIVDLLKIVGSIGRHRNVYHLCNVYLHISCNVCGNDHHCFPSTNISADHFQSALSRYFLQTFFHRLVCCEKNYLAQLMQRKVDEKMNGICFTLIKFFQFFFWWNQKVQNVLFCWVVLYNNELYRQTLIIVVNTRNMYKPHVFQCT